MSSITSPYGPVPLQPGYIRLLRILPHGNLPLSPIRCELFEYALVGPGGQDRGPHFYQALSYVWGHVTSSPSIAINGCAHNVTANLHEALLALRNHSFERIMWIDAVCIKQDDLTERARQVELMAEIYSKASLVVVWLGQEAAIGPILRHNKASEALEKIRLAAEENSVPSIDFQEKEIIPESVVDLVRRSWFKRVWVSLFDDTALRIGHSLICTICLGTPGGCCSSTGHGYGWLYRD